MPSGPDKLKLDEQQAPLWVCYCDYDGVVHRDEVYTSTLSGIYMNEPGYALFEWLPILEALLAPHPDVKIVLSTSWVRLRGFEFAKAQLSKSLQAKVIGATFDNRLLQKLEFDLMPRGVQVLTDAKSRRPARWFAIDDDDVGWPPAFRGNLIKTDGRLGLSDPLVQQAIVGMLSSYSSTA